jgi:hypothetical protein
MHLKGKNEPSHKHTAIDLGMKIIVIHKDEGMKRLSSIACELDFAVLTVKDSAFIKEHVNSIFHLYIYTFYLLQHSVVGIFLANEFVI